MTVIDTHFEDTYRGNVAQPVAMFAALLLLCLLVAGCGIGLGEPVVRIYSPGVTGTLPAPQQDTTGTATAAGANSGRIHTVRPGETLYGVARSYAVPLRSLILMNDLTPPYVLQVGQRLTIPAAQRHRVVKGDTISAIAGRYGIDMSALVRLNDLAPPYLIHIGQELALPAPVTPVASAAASDAPGDDGFALQPIAREELPSANAGNAVAVSDPATDARPVAVTPAPAVNSTTQTAAPAPLPSTFSMAASGAPRPRAKPPAPRMRVARGDIPRPQPRADDRFLWPLKGRLVSQFGGKTQGLRNDGLNIAAPRGTPVRAAENGVVAYSGSELKGFGNMVLIKHADGYLTAYGHNEKLLVERGQAIRKGQAIARVGSSGNVESPQLHFQIRKGRKVLNPLKYLDG